MNKGMSLNSKFSEVDSLDMTLSHTTENGDSFNESADEDYSKILDYSDSCPAQRAYSTVFEYKADNRKIFIF